MALTATYEEFLARKARTQRDVGIDIADDAIHPSLFPFQRALVRWALRKGRACLWTDTGTGKTRMQLEWARLTGARTLILAPLAVAAQTIREGAVIDIPVVYARHQDEAGPGIIITNYERLDRFDPDTFDAVVLDESSILKAFDGIMRRRITEAFQATRWRLACTATPAPNDVVELTNHAVFVGAMSRVDMLAAYFVHDDEGWRLKGHAEEPMYRWMATWAAALRRPSDLGYADDGYVLPDLRIVGQVVPAHLVTDGQLFSTTIGGVGGRFAVRRHTLPARVERVLELIDAQAGEKWLVWCGLNDEQDTLARALGARCVSIAGRTPSEQKIELEAAWREGDVPVMLTKSGIFGYGMNWQHCARMAFVGLNDSYEQYYQAIRRCWRYGQARPVEAHVVVSDLEQEVVANVAAKERQASRMTASLVRHITAHLETAP